MVRSLLNVAAIGKERAVMRTLNFAWKGSYWNLLRYVQLSVFTRVKTLAWCIFGDHVFETSITVVKFDATLWVFSILTLVLDRIIVWCLLKCTRLIFLLLNDTQILFLGRLLARIVLKWIILIFVETGKVRFIGRTCLLWLFLSTHRGGVWRIYVNLVHSYEL